MEMVLVALRSRICRGEVVDSFGQGGPRLRWRTPVPWDTFVLRKFRFPFVPAMGVVTLLLCALGRLQL